MTRESEFKLREGLWADSDRLSNLALDALEEWCGIHSLNASRLMGFVRMLSEENSYHPVRQWLESKKWDGVSRLNDLADTIKVEDAHTAQWKVYLRKWMLSAVAALYGTRLDGHKFSSRSVLVFTDDQNTGKTSWFRKLVPQNLDAFGEGKHLDPANRDSLVEVLSYWIVELGEIDSTFKKVDIARIKAFLSKTKDDLRLPYARVPDKWRRQTVFGGTVNDGQFLMDQSGNTRWWVVAPLSIDFKHDIDMQQLWAEVKILVDCGETWFLDGDELRTLTAMNTMFEIEDPIESGLTKYFKFASLEASWNHPMTIGDIFDVIGVQNPNRGHVVKAGAILKKLVGSPVQQRLGGRRGRYYYMPGRRAVDETFNAVEEGENNKKGDVLNFKPVKE
jgi:putative DNA primase/helicase